MQIRHELGRYLELIDPAADRTIWRYVYSGKPKPFFHPLCAPGGQTLTISEPHDHLWQRGLYFAFKFVNGDNFWEEKPADGIGAQRTLFPPSITHLPDGSIRFDSQLEWVAPADRGVVLQENRTFTHRTLLDEPTGRHSAAGDYALDFDFTLTPTRPVKLDRTPFTGSWGGYGGLNFRGTRNWEKLRLLLSDGPTEPRAIGPRAKWADLSGRIDGGEKITGGLAIFDHPENLRHPTPWYGRSDTNYSINAALLFHEPLELAAGQALRLRYRVLVHEGIWEKDRLEEAWQAYAPSPMTPK